MLGAKLEVYIPLQNFIIKWIDKRAFESKSPFLQQNRSFISMVLFLWVCGILGVIVKSIINKNDIGLYRKVVFDFRPKFHNGDEQSP